MRKIIYLSVLLGQLCFAPLTCLSQVSKGATAFPHGFIANGNQLHDQNYLPVPDVRYQLSLPGLNVALKDRGFSYNAWKPDPSARPSADPVLAGTGNARESRSFSFHRIDVDFIGASPMPVLLPEDGADAEENYYTGPSGPTGALHLRKYGTVLYRNVWPLIDVRFYLDETDHKTLEYDFILHPGAHSSDIKLGYSGAQLSGKTESSLVFKTSVGAFTEHLPHSYRYSDKSKVDVQYVVLHADYHALRTEIGFTGLPETIVEKTVIDPTPNLSWSTYLGGTGYELIESVITDVTGNIYATGTVASIANIATTGAHQTVYGGGDYDVLLVKYSKQGTRLWSTYYGGSATDEGSGIVLDGSGRPLITGYTASATGISTPGAQQTVKDGPADAYLAKFNANGVRMWGRYFGGNEYEGARSILHDTDGKLYLLGYSTSYLLGTPGVSNPGPPLNGDCFLARFDSAANLEWLTFAGGAGSESAAGAAFDNHGDIIILGQTQSATGIATAGAHQPLLGSSSDCFIQKWNTSGIRIWGTYYGGSQPEFPHEIATDTAANIYFTGQTNSANNIATPGSHQPAPANPNAPATINSDAFLVKLNSAGVRQWGTFIGGAAFEFGFALAVTKGGSCYASGQTFSTTGITTPGTWSTTSPGGGTVNAYIMKFSTNGVLQWGTYFGGNIAGNWATQSRAIRVDEDDKRIIIGGSVTDPNIATPGAAQTTLGGQADCFVASFTECYAPSVATVNITAVPTGPVCKGTTTVFTAGVSNAGNNPQYIWLRNGVVVPGATGSSYTTDSLQNGDTIACRILSDDACAQPAVVLSNAIIATIHPLPVAVITANGNLLSTAPYTSYQWLLGNMAIAGATSQQYTATASGDYRVVVFDGNGCRDTSDARTITITIDPGVGVPSIPDEAALKLYPNPVVDGVFVLEGGEAGHLTISDIAGRTVASYPIQKGNNTIYLPAGTAPGMYTGRFLIHSSQKAQVIRIAVAP